MKTEELTQKEVCDKAYMTEYLESFINQELHLTKIVSNGRWMLYRDYESEMRFLALDYLDKHFTLEEAFEIFQFIPFFSCKREHVVYNKSDAIERISLYSTLTKEESNKLKRKIWNMDLTTFAAIYLLIQDSDVFWDDEAIDFLYPYEN